MPVREWHCNGIVHCISTARICRITEARVRFWFNKGDGQKHGNEIEKKVDELPACTNYTTY